MRTIVLALLLAAPLGAQELPDKPIATVRVKLIDDSTNKPVMMTLRVPHRTIDRSFVLWTASSVAATVLDLENTRLALDAGGKELNPLYGSHPSRARQYGVGMGITGVATWLSFRYKRHEDAASAFGARTSRSNHWWLVPLANIATHGVGTVFTLGNTGL